LTDEILGGSGRLAPEANVCLLPLDMGEIERTAAGGAANFRV
jgi:hypothetical protein